VPPQPPGGGVVRVGSGSTVPAATSGRSQGTCAWTVRTCIQEMSTASSAAAATSGARSAAHRRHTAEPTRLSAAAASRAMNGQAGTAKRKAGIQSPPSSTMQAKSSATQAPVRASSGWPRRTAQRSSSSSATPSSAVTPSTTREGISGGRPPPRPVPTELPRKEAR
jgi:hypothetical protein